MAASPPPAVTPSELPREFRVWDLVLFNLSAVAGIRWLPAAAHTGPGSLSLWVLATLTFFIPSALVISSLSARFPDEGGLYIWTKNAFGDWHGYLAAWLYFVGNILYFPSLLLACVTMGSFIFGPGAARLANVPAFAISVTLTVLIAAFLLNFFGIRFGKWPGIVGGAATYAIAILLVLLAALVASRYGSATTFHLLPEASWDNVNFWSQIAFAMVGLEVGAILGGEIRDPARTIPRAAAISGVGVATFYIAGTASLLVLLPAAQINSLTGLVDIGQSTGARLGVTWLSPGLALLVTGGLLGQLTAYIAGNTRLPFVIGIDRYLPRAFAKLHPRWHSPYVSILTQAILAAAVLLTAQLGETLRSAYQILVDMTVITTLIPFVYIFAAGFRFGSKLAGATGAIVSTIAVLLSLSPPAGVSSVAAFELKVVGGCLLFVLAGRLLFLRYQRPAP